MSPAARVVTRRQDIHSPDEIRAWLAATRRVHSLEARRIPLRALTEWHFAADTGDLMRRRGGFFTVTGIEAHASCPTAPSWSQPIVDQPEVGVLGFLARSFDGVLHVLVQAKLEPGNPDVVQLSPTVQATRSNYTQAHGGRRPEHIDWFLGPRPGRVLLDQLQREHGGHFLGKRSRNIVVELAAADHVAEGDAFRWLSLRQLCRLLEAPNLLSMNTRNLLACLLCARGPRAEMRRPAGSATGFGAAVRASARAGDGEARTDSRALARWVAEMGRAHRLAARRVGLRQLREWVVDDEGLHHVAGQHLSIVGVSAEATNREVASWDQPMIAWPRAGVVAFLCQRKRGVLHFVVQARVEPGHDGIELGPTLQHTPVDYGPELQGTPSPFQEAILHAAPDRVRWCTEQSEEGGRYHCCVSRYVVVEIPPEEPLELPPDYAWMTLRQIRTRVRRGDLFNVESRSLVACLAAAALEAGAGGDAPPAGR